MIAVVGAHRSGTSFLCRLLMGLGIPFGNEDGFLPADAGNRDGYFEQRDVLDLNSRLISGWPYTRGLWRRRMGQVIYGTQPTDGSLARRFEQLRPEVEHLRSKYAGVTVKDPRFCLLWRFWHEVRPLDGLVVCLRHPLETALSLRKRQHLPLSLGFRFWEWHIQSVLDGLTDDSTMPGQVWVSYDRLSSSSPERELHSLRRFFRVALPMSKVREVHLAAFRPHLRHFRVNEDCDLPWKTRALWREVCRRLEQNNRADANGQR